MVKKVLILGHSYITRLKSYIREDPEQCTFTLNLDPQEVKGGGTQEQSQTRKTETFWAQATYMYFKIG